MVPTDKPAFSALLTGCLQAIYDKPVSPMMLDVWFNALSGYPLADVSTAFSRHLTDPDHGQFPPKPADLIRAIDGSGDGRALLAWTKVDKAIRHVGGWRSVCFDDPLIHAGIVAMGGWIKLCETKSDELPYRQQEFAKRYRALMLAGPPEYPPHLIGRAEAGNALQGYPSEPPLLLGDPHKAAQVRLGGAPEATNGAMDARRLVSSAIKRLAPLTEEPML